MKVAFFLIISACVLFVGCGRIEEKAVESDGSAGNPTANNNGGDFECDSCEHCGKKFKTLGDVYGHAGNCPKAPKDTEPAPTVDELPYH